MSGRIWPGALCYLNHNAEPENQGAVVRAVNVWGIEDGCEWWEFDQASRPIAVFDDDGIIYWALNSDDGPDGAVISASELTPITPPPSADTTEDRSPCEVESV